MSRVINYNTAGEMIVANENVTSKERNKFQSIYINSRLNFTNMFPGAQPGFFRAGSIQQNEGISLYKGNYVFMENEVRYFALKNII